MLNWLSDWWARERIVEVIREQPSPTPELDLELRRWDGAATHRGNKAQFEAATGRSINEDLVSQLPTLLDRCAFEATTDPTIEGMIDCHCIDILGPRGPQWRVVPQNAVNLTEEQMQDFAAYAVEAEEVLQEWFDAPDFNGELSGFEILQMVINQQWTAGNSFTQIVNSREFGDSPVDIRLHPIHAERILKQSLLFGEKKAPIVLGIERDSFGRKTRYHVREANEWGVFGDASGSNPIDAVDMIHLYRIREPGQIAGVPLMASALPTIGDIREFDKLTMEAAKLAASLGIIFEDKFEKTPRDGRKASGLVSRVKMGMASILHAPKGKSAVQIDPKHPSSRYVEFRNERWRDVGRAVQMPLMIVRLGSEEHSYSSARFDGQIYQRGIRRDQGNLRRKFAGVLLQVLREAELMGRLRPRPYPIEIGASWTRMPHVDPKKEADARRMDLESLTTTLIDVWQEEGHRPHEMVERMKRTVTLLNSVSSGLGDAYLNNLITPHGLARADEILTGQSA